MRLQDLSPAMQDAEKPDLGAEVFGIRRHFQQGGSGGLEQKSEQDFFVLPHQWDKQVRHAENEMKIVHGQQLLLALGEPLLASAGLAFRTMPIPTRVIGDRGTMPTAGALIEVTAECGSPTARNGQQHFDVLPADPLAVSFDEGSSGAADDIGHLQRWPTHLFHLWRLALERQGVQTDWRPHAGDVARDAGSGLFLSDRCGLTGAEWCADRHRLRVGARPESKFSRRALPTQEAIIRRMLSFPG